MTELPEPNTGYYAFVVADSLPHDTYGQVSSRLSTLEVCFPRFILAEFNTHRVLSRNSASSRAIPVAKQLERIDKYPFVPEWFPINKPGMSATEYLRPGDKGYDEALEVWLNGRDSAVTTAKALMDLGVHKQTANRVLEPYMWHSAVVTATEYENFYALRISEYAQPEIRRIAEMMKAAMDESNPTMVAPNEWHLPYVDEDEKKVFTEIALAQISAGRCAAVTLLNQQAKNPMNDLIRTRDKLAPLGHMSPLEHPAKNSGYRQRGSNFTGVWQQYRKFFPGEAVYGENYYA